MSRPYKSIKALIGKDNGRSVQESMSSSGVRSAIREGVGSTRLKNTLDRLDRFVNPEKIN